MLHFVFMTYSVYVPRAIWLTICLRLLRLFLSKIAWRYFTLYAPSINYTISNWNWLLCKWATGNKERCYLNSIWFKNLYKNYSTSEQIEFSGFFAIFTLYAKSICNCFISVMDWIAVYKFRYVGDKQIENSRGKNSVMWNSLPILKPIRLNILYYYLFT